MTICLIRLGTIVEKINLSNEKTTDDFLHHFFFVQGRQPISALVIVASLVSSIGI